MHDDEGVLQDGRQLRGDAVGGQLAEHNRNLAHLREVLQRLVIRQLQWEQNRLSECRRGVFISLLDPNGRSTLAFGGLLYCTA